MVWIDTYNPTGWSILRHNGTHNHPWPEAKKLDPLSKDLLRKQVKCNPRAGAFQLKVCELPNYHTWAIWIWTDPTFPSRWEGPMEMVK
jgi:hypothetical protein